MPCAPRCSVPSEMMPAPMPVATLMNTRSATSRRWACCSPSAMMFTSLSTSTGTANARCTWPGTSYRSHPGMIGGLIARPVECSTGPGRPIPIAASSRDVATLVGEQLADHLLDPAEHALRTERDVERHRPLGEDPAVEVGDRGGRVGGAEVDTDHDPGSGVEGQQRRRPAAGRDPSERHHEAEPHQRFQPGGDRRPGQSGGLDELRPGARLTVPEKVEDVAGPHARSQPRRTSVRPANNFCRPLDRSG